MLNRLQLIVGHVSGYQERMPTCVCGEPWPCAKALSPASGGV